MWLALAILFACAALGLHLWWRSRFARLETQLTAARQALHKAEASLDLKLARGRAHQQVLFNSMVEGVLLLDSTGRIQTTNRSLARLFQLDRDIRGLTIMEAFRSHELLDVVQRAREEGQVTNFEMRLPGIHHTQYVEVNAAAVRESASHPEEIILIFHDFTRIKELEGMRKDFVANVSHELRTPLTLIKGYVETLIDGAKNDPEVATRFLQTIHKHSNRLAFLIEDLLTISQLESGRVIMQPQWIPLHSGIERTLDELQTPAAQKKISLQNEVPPTLRAYADADRLRQVLYNLIDNGIKYGRPGGTVCVGAEEKEGVIQVMVKDDGPGIPPEACERVFERFYRVDRARSREQGGTGLGLSIVKHIVQSHGGEVWVESGHGQGYRFFLTLPNPLPSAEPAA